MRTSARWSRAAVAAALALLVTPGAVSAQPAAALAGGADQDRAASAPGESTPLLVPNARVSLMTVDLANWVGDLVSADADTVTVRLSEGRRAGAVVAVPLRDIREVAVQKGRHGRGRSALMGAVGMAALIAPVAMVFTAVDYDDEELQRVAAEGALSVSSAARCWAP